MKVLHITPHYIPAYRYGGPIKATHELCRALARKGLEVSVFTTNVDVDGYLDVAVNVPQDIEGVRVVYCPAALAGQYCYSKDLSRRLKDEIKQFDLVHIHFIYLYPTLIAGQWCRRHKIPYIINPFGALDSSMIRLKGYLKKTLYIKTIEKRNIEKASAIHAASVYERDKIKLLKFRTPTIVVPRGINIEEYERTPDSKDPFPKLKDKKIILFLGRIHFKKGFDLFALALKKITQKRKDVHLIIAGPDEKGYASKVKKMFANLNLEQYVTFTGMLLGNEKLYALHRSDIFVLPSYGENFGIAVLEAMACKLPVVITDRVGLYHDVKEYNTGIITDCDENQIADGILKLLSDDNARKEMGENGKRLAMEKYTWDKISGEMIDVYENIIKKQFLCQTKKISIY